PKSSPKSVDALEAKEVPAEEPQVADEDADYQKAVEESMKDAYALPKGPLPPVVAHDLLSLQKHKKTSPVDQYIFQRRVSEPTASSFHDESPYEVLGQSDSEEESKKITLGVEKGGQDEDEGFTATVYPNVQENLKLAVEEPVLLEEPASSSGTLSSLQHLSRDFSFGDQFFSDKHLDADKNIETEVESMFSAKGTKREVFRIPIPGSLITADIREASYYKEYQANVAKHRKLLASETGSAQDSPAPKPAKPARKPKPIAQKARINILQYLVHRRM
nr:hypothetical protein [Tanacetum cinerariifolium]